MKKLTAILMCAALTVASVVSVFGATPEEEVKAARAAQEQRIASYQAYQAQLEALAAQALAQGDSAKAAGYAAQAQNQAKLAADAAAALAQGQVNLENVQAAAAA